MGGPGLNLGLQDAINLGWKLAAEINGWAPAGLLDTYESERHPVAERVMMHSLAQSALIAPGPEISGLRDLVAELVRIPAVAAHLAELLAGSDTRYDVGDDHHLSGRLAPDFSVTTDGTRMRIADLLHTARPLLIDGTGVAAAVAEEWRDRIEIVSGAITLTESNRSVDTASGPDIASTPAAMLLAHRRVRRMGRRRRECRRSASGAHPVVRRSTGAVARAVRWRTEITGASTPATSATTAASGRCSRRS